MRHPLLPVDRPMFGFPHENGNYFNRVRIKGQIYVWLYFPKFTSLITNRVEGAFIHNRGLSTYWARAQSCAMCPLALSCLSVRLHVSARPTLDGFPWKVCWENPDLVKIGQKYRELDMKTYVGFIVATDFKSP